MAEPRFLGRHMHFLDFLSSPIRHRKLIYRLTRREIEARYRGSLLGVLWSMINPVLMLCVYTFIFSVVFKARWGDSGRGTEEFALLLFSGLIVFWVFAEVVNQAPHLLIENKVYIKKVVFPLEILPWITLGGALFRAAMSFVILALFYLIVLGVPPVTAVAFPVAFAPLCLVIMGIAWFLASLGVFLRDIQQFIGILTTAMMFLSPIFYPITAIPESYRALLYLNPLTVVLESTKGALFWGVWPNWLHLGIYTVLAACVASSGYWWFMRTRKAFADVV